MDMQVKSMTRHKNSTRVDMQVKSVARNKTKKAKGLASKQTAKGFAPKPKAKWFAPTQIYMDTRVHSKRICHATLTTVNIVSTTADYRLP